MSRSVKSEPTKGRAGKGLRSLSLAELVGKSGRAKGLHEPDKKEPILVRFAHCRICNLSASEDELKGAGAVAAFFGYHKLKHQTRAHVAKLRQAA